MVIIQHKDQSSQVRLNSELSGSFFIVNGVEQGCGLAPTLFSFFFSMMLKQVIENLNDVYICYRLDGNLFNLRRLHVHTKILEQLFRALLFADEATPVVYTERPLEQLTSCFADDAQLFGLEVSLKKIEELHQPAPLEEYHPPHITIGVTELKYHHLRVFERFYQSCLRTILDIHWSNYVSNADALDQAEITSKEAMLLKAHLW